MVFMCVNTRNFKELFEMLINIEWRELQVGSDKLRVVPGMV